MDERVKRDIIMFLAVLISCLIFVGTVETFTGILSETRERNLTNRQNIESISDMFGARSVEAVETSYGALGLYDYFLFKNFF